MSHMLVPPRRGLRAKTHVLPGFNHNKQFQVVEIDHEDKYGLLDDTQIPNQNDEYPVFVENDLAASWIHRRRLRILNLPLPPKHAYTETSAVIGGVGKHTRWNIVMSKNKHVGETQLIVSNIFCEAAFVSFVNTNIRPFGFCDFVFDTMDDIKYTIVSIPDHCRLTHVAAAFHCAGYHASPADERMASAGKLGIERYDRSEHTWWNQDQKKAGPLRDTHRWKYGFIPKEWKTIPFTWWSLAEQINVPDDRVGDVPLPLRNYVCDVRAKENDSILRHKAYNGHCVTSRLSYEQNIQLLCCAYWTFAAPFDAIIVRIAHILQFRYMLYGYLGRELGGYQQTAGHIGYGAQIRKFKNKPQYNVENLQNSTLNRVIHKGVMKGTGFKGTRGKYGHAAFNKYMPRNKMRRSVEAEVRMRQIPSNCFQEYAVNADTKQAAQPEPRD